MPVAKNLSPPTFILSGGIGSGKSTAGSEFARLGAEVIDTDKIVEELNQPGQIGHLAMVGAFGESVLLPNGALNKKQAARRLFADHDARQKIEAQVHPAVWSRISIRMDRLDDTSTVVLEIPLLKTRPEGVCGIIAVNTCVELAIERLEHGGRGIPPDEARARIRTQPSNEERAALADRVIENNGSLEAFTASIGDTWRWMLAVRQSAGS